MATFIATPTKAPRARKGPHYANPTSKPIVGPLSTADREDLQRLTWKLFFILVLCVFAVGVGLSMADF